MLVLINNKFVKKKDAKVPILSSFGRGFGIFETMKTKDKKIIQGKAHIERLFKSAEKIGLKMRYKKNEISKMIEKIAKKSSHASQRIKITAIPEMIIVTSEKNRIDPKIYKGVSCMSIKAKREMPEIKSISYIISYICNEKAKKLGFFDAILIDEKEEVYECAYANLFWFEGDALCTRGDQILPGITRQTIMKISPFEIVLKTIKLKELNKKEAFLSSSIQGIVPITKIDKTKIGDGKPGEKTKTLMELLNQTETRTSSHLQPRM